MKRKPPELLPGALFYARFPAPPAPLQGLFIWGGFLYPYYIRGLIWLYRGYIRGVYIGTCACLCPLSLCIGFLCFLLCYLLCVLGSCLCPCVAGLAPHGFVLGLAFAAVNWVYSIECVRVYCQ